MSSKCTGKTHVAVHVQYFILPLISLSFALFCNLLVLLVVVVVVLKVVLMMVVVVDEQVYRRG